MEGHGRPVGPSDESWSFFYSKSEVLFMVNVTGRLTMEDVLAKLP
jgi:hypothetical protein